SALQQEMRRIHQLLGRTIVLVTHDIDEALGLAEHLVLMDNGEVVQQGTPLALLTAPRNDFVRDFFGRSELGVRLLSLKQVGDFIEPGMADGAPVAETLTLREAMSVFVERQCEALSVVDATGAHRGVLRFRHLVNQREARGE
ncbi:ABC transporter ATP-binding protein, partial [Cronobacter sakazakii]